jgi:hypothetical protein
VAYGYVNEGEETLMRRGDTIIADNIVGAGKAEGSPDAGNMLEPMLARGELHCIGATTLDEHRR